ncbi:nucleolar protein 14 [Fistulifera solaris]|uniref:Nucleolar protein 14 n=1 Tax=Fistulifera solaris TaxID=1519565 RepID=A0A1Z5JWV5_FISSO|nr:nucleolar protein 14 [Fistulifera solaris]|eukprot:GAX18342.1 nucleolar protein 14 [Fistulifera solaris]
MGKRKTRSKRSASSLPKGLPVRNVGGSNPFEVSAAHKRPKFQVHNRVTSKQPQAPSKLAQALQKRKHQVQSAYKASKKANVFADNRIGEYDDTMTAEQQNLARLVRERSRQSKKHAKYSLEDDDILTHRGKAVDQIQHHNIVLSDDEDEDAGNLDAADTALHFGGGENSTKEKFDYYGNQAEGTAERMAQLYEKRKMDLDDLILRRKILKAEKMQSKEHQAERFAALDESFDQIAAQLQFRDKEKEIRQHLASKREGTLSPEDAEMADWDKEMKEYLHVQRKVKASDRTKTPEEIAKEEAERLHKLETRRLARMNGDFEDDDFSDLSDNETKGKRKRRKKDNANPEELSDSDDDETDDEKVTTRFTADGLVRVNKDGIVVGKAGEEIDGSDEDDEEDDTPKETPALDLPAPLEVRTRVNASYRAKEQYDGNESWFTGIVEAVHNDSKGGFKYDVRYDDGDFEEEVEPQFIRVLARSAEELEKEDEATAKDSDIKFKRQLAKEKARSQIPFVFEVPTTLEALHDIIATHATTGKEASLIMSRIHKANSVRLDRRNSEKMQNFYDVLIRRFIAVGDAIHKSGDGGAELGRYAQLDALVKLMYDMAQDAPESAAAVWSRRLGFFENAHAKRLRDSEFVRDDGEEAFSAWPSTGVFLALRALCHIFPATDLRHQIVTPAVLLLGQIVSHTPVATTHDLAMGILHAGLLIEYTREAKRVSPEAHGFLAGVIRLFAAKEEERRLRQPVPSLEHAAEESHFTHLRIGASRYTGEDLPQLSLEKQFLDDDSTPAALLNTALQLAQVSVQNLNASLFSAGTEAFFELTASILAIDPKAKKCPLPSVIQKAVASSASSLSLCLSSARSPLKRRQGSSIQEKAIKTLAPRLEDPERYSMSKDKGKSATQAAADRVRREYKREHKAVARELRMDATMVENERRHEKQAKDSTERAKRHKAFAWMENEQATMNQQVRQGGGLLQGGGMGAAKAKAASGKLGIKKGGKF